METVENFPAPSQGILIHLLKNIISETKISQVGCGLQDSTVRPQMVLVSHCTRRNFNNLWECLPCTRHHSEHFRCINLLTLTPSGEGTIISPNLETTELSHRKILTQVHLPGFAAPSLDVWFSMRGLQPSISQVSFPGACLMPQSNEWVFWSWDLLLDHKC